jgi:chromate transporter
VNETNTVTKYGAPPAPTLSEALRYWFRLGCIGFGGPAGQIAIMHQELVERRRWISERRFLHALNYCMLLPGPEAQQLATYIGWLLHGITGGIIAGVLFVLPSLFVLVALSWVYMAYGHVPAVAGVLYGVKPAVVAIVAFAAYRIGSRALRNAVLVAVAILAFLAIFVFHAPFPSIIAGAAILGAVGGRIVPDKFKAGGGHQAAVKHYGPAVIDDASPPPRHANFEWSRSVGVAAIGIGIWAVALGLLALRLGWHGALTQMGWFFTKAALLTFGGAYAVLPYVYQGAVEHYQWLSAPQMIDGLALGETTPGPLIMVVAYVGFVGMWTQALAGSDSLLLAGVLGATVATFFTFLPSFLFILIGAPLVEATHGDIKFTAPLTAITAAIVGVIANLACFFAYHVMWPQGFAGHFDWLAAIIAAGASVMLFKFNSGIIRLIAVCAVLGWFVRVVV